MCNRAIYVMEKRGAFKHVFGFKWLERHDDAQQLNTFSIQG